VATLPFWLLWIEYVIAAGVGLIIISQASPIGQEVAKLTPVVAGGALTILAVLNGLGRPGFGYISDAIGRARAMSLVFALYIVSMMFILPNATTFGTYVFGLCLVGFAFGGTLALMPAFTADFFGTKGLGINYAWVFTAYGVAGGTLVLYAARVRQITGAWTTAFWYMTIICAVGLVLTFITKAPTAKEA